MKSEIALSPREYRYSDGAYIFIYCRFVYPNRAREKQLTKDFIRNPLMATNPVKISGIVRERSRRQLSSLGVNRGSVNKKKKGRITQPQSLGRGMGGRNERTMQNVYQTSCDTRRGDQWLSTTAGHILSAISSLTRITN